MKNETKQIEMKHLNQPYDGVDGVFNVVNVETIHNSQNGLDYTLWTTNVGNVHIWESDYNNYEELVETNNEIMNDINNGEIITYVIEDGGHEVDGCIFP